MTDLLRAAPRPPISPDDPARRLAVAAPDDAGMPHVAVGGNVHSALLGGEQTGGRHCPIETRVPSHGGPPLLRRHFEELFWAPEGEIDATGRSPARCLTARPPKHDERPDHLGARHADGGKQARHMEQHVGRGSLAGNRPCLPRGRPVKGRT